MKKIYNNIQHTLAFLLLMIATACEDFVTIEPPQTTLSTTTVFQDESTARAAVNRIYIDMVQFSESFCAGATSLNNMAGLAADELDNYSAFNEMAPFAANELTALNVNLQAAWNQIYNLIYQANAVIEGLNKSTSIQETVKSQLIGEAKFMRAYFHLLLVSYWGDIPWVSSTDYVVNSKTTRNAASEVYQNIIADLLDAKSKLPESVTLKIRPTKIAAAAMLARVYLYTQNYAAAETEATEVIANAPLEADLNNVFLIGSTEIVFQLQSVIPRISSWDGNTYILRSAPTVVALTNMFMQAFEPGDLRMQAWTKSYTDGSDTWYHPFKYKVRRLPQDTSPKTEFQVLIRSGELYLIRAEARANLNNIVGAAEDLNAIRSRAGLVASAASDKSTMLLAIENERRFELFTENGHRWLDLKRTGRLDAVIGTTKANWQVTDALFPIPQTERNRNANLSQNPGY